MITRPKNPLELQEIMTAMLTAEDNTDLIHSFKSARVTITSEEPVPWTLDGEYGGSHTQIEIGKLPRSTESVSEKYEKMRKPDQLEIFPVKLK